MELSQIDRLMGRNICGGQTIIVAGRRGEGKTFLTISLVQNSMDGLYHLEKPVVCITNTAFGYRSLGSSMPVERYPPGVYHEDTLAGTLRKVGEIMSEYGPGNVIIIWVLDEAQNFMISDMNGSKENLALTQFLGNARKFDLCNFFLTPAINNMTPRIRCFPDGDEKSGYCSCQILKDRSSAERIAANKGMDPHKISFFRESAKAPFSPMVIQSGSWTKGLYSKGTNVEGYSYDTKSTATFSIGENENGVPFNLSDFMKATSKGLSHEVPGKIEAFFEAWDALGGDDSLPGEDLVILRNREQCERMKRMRELNIKWKEIAQIEGENEDTLRSRLRNYELRLSRKTEEASKNGKREIGVPSGAVYIQPYREKALEGGLSRLSLDEDPKGEV